METWEGNLLPSHNHNSNTAFTSIMASTLSKVDLPATSTSITIPILQVGEVGDPGRKIWTLLIRANQNMKTRRRANCL